ncbi:MAG TPA: (2Fe-2S)-binding protein [Stellaceae bacterium]|jgi:carbon-monoxide dehydrogenase small subunit|nr:(2Fe-2S)-binding protein [Stellaceae bacterium]
MSRHHVSTVINGEPADFLCEPQQTLLDVLRDELNLTGSKEGCGSGDCGACSVILDGRLVCSCLMLAVEAEGHSVQTIEGLATGNKLHPVQQKFLEHAALQCGFCTPGLLVAAKALLDRNPKPTETEARYWLAGNLCRCTGYDKVIRAVLDAAAEMRGE